MPGTPRHQRAQVGRAGVPPRLTTSDVVWKPREEISRRRSLRDRRTEEWFREERRDGVVIGTRDRSTRRRAGELKRACGRYSHRASAGAAVHRHVRAMRSFGFTLRHAAFRHHAACAVCTGGGARSGVRTGRGRRHVGRARRRRNFLGGERQESRERQKRRQHAESEFHTRIVHLCDGKRNPSARP